MTVISAPSGARFTASWIVSTSSPSPTVSGASYTAVGPVVIVTSWESSGARSSPSPTASGLLAKTNVVSRITDPTVSSSDSTSTM